MPLCIFCAIASDLVQSLSVLVARKQTNLFKRDEVTATHFLLLYVCSTPFLCVLFVLENFCMFVNECFTGNNE